MDIPVFVTSEGLRAIDLGRLKKLMKTNRAQMKDIQQLERDISDMERLRDRGLVSPGEFKHFWHRAYGHYCGMVCEAGRICRTGE